MNLTATKLEFENKAGYPTFKPSSSARENAVATIISNLLESGILLPDETEAYCEVLCQYRLSDLLLVLDESFKLKASWDSLRLMSA